MYVYIYIYIYIYIFFNITLYIYREREGEIIYILQNQPTFAERCGKLKLCGICGKLCAPEQNIISIYLSIHLSIHLSIYLSTSI